MHSQIREWHCKEAKLESHQLARTIVDMLEERKAENILLLDVQEVTILADYFVICSATSERQIRALSGDLSRQLKAEVGKPLNVEGQADSGWVLVDYGDVIVHIFSPSMRTFYDLEGFWKEAKTVVRIQ
jgi:ribosome-associated protein